jgi:Zn-dependent peptidase ImmA (M78 family)/transcriptional regulator with XRE-family HTH domain
MSREFVASRLELARSFEHLTLKALASKVSASTSLLGHYENGLRKQPADDLLAALAEALKVKPEFFFEPLSDVWREDQCSFRRRVATPEGIKKRARAHGSMIGLVIRELATKVQFPKYNIPELRADSMAQIDDVAERCRKIWGLGLGPIPHVGRVAEHHGVVLVQHLQHADKIDAFARRGEHSIIVLNTARTSTSRWIFDVAHELGHFVLHHGIETGSRETEAQANYFASALLLPKATFGLEFRSRPFSWPHVFELKRRWFTSAAAIIRRAFNLSLLDAVAYRRCYQFMSIQGWLKKEPHEPEFVGPEWLPSAFLLAETFGLTPAVLCDRLHITQELFTKITGLEVEPIRLARFKPKLVRG